MTTPPTALGRLIAGAVARHPDRVAVHVGRRRRTYRELAADAAAVGTALDAVWRGSDVLGVVAAEAGQGIAEHLLAITRARSIVFGPDAGVVGSVASVVLRDGVAHRVADPPSWATTVDAAPFVVLPTSGTTGAPKLTVHTHETLLWGLWSAVSWPDELGGDVTVPVDVAAVEADLLRRIEGSDEPSGFFSAMPLSSIAGLSVVHRSLMVGDHLVTPAAGFRATEALDLIDEDGVQKLALAPFMARELVRAVRGRERRPALLAVGIGGGPADPALVASVEEALGVAVLGGYGSTECGGVVTLARPWDPVEVRHGSVGRPLAATRIDIGGGAGADGGPVLARSPASMVGTIEGGRVRPAPEWIDLGDQGHLDPDGNLVVHGRRDRTIVRGGRRIDPTAIERRLAGLPGVAAVVVVSDASRVAGETDVVAVVRPDADLTARQVIEASVGDDGRARVQRVVFVDELPRTADGQVRIASLSEVVRAAR